MAGTVRIDWHPAGIAAITGPRGDAGRWLRSRSLACAGFARANAPKRTGFMSRTIHSTAVERAGFRLVSQVRAPARYSLYQELGTGPIRPKKPGGWLRWTDRAGQVVFAKSTRGVPATHFMEKALLQALPGAQIRRYY